MLWKVCDNVKGSRLEREIGATAEFLDLGMITPALEGTSKTLRFSARKEITGLACCYILLRLSTREAVIRIGGVVLRHTPYQPHTPSTQIFHGRYCCCCFPLGHMSDDDVFLSLFRLSSSSSLFPEKASVFKGHKSNQNFVMSPEGGWGEDIWQGLAHSVYYKHNQKKT